MGWARTLRVGATLDGEDRTGIAAALQQRGCAVAFGPATEFCRAYALVEGGDEIAPEIVAECAECIEGGRLYDEAIIALAIELFPEEALRATREALGGDGRPAGVLGCDVMNAVLLLETSPARTPFSTIAAILDVELRRWSGSRKTTLLAPLPLAVTASIAGEGLQAPEVAPDRVLEALLRANVR